MMIKFLFHFPHLNVSAGVDVPTFLSKDRFGIVQCPSEKYGLAAYIHVMHDEKD